MKEKILSLLGCGLSNEVVASAVGCTPSYITQLLSQPEFNDRVIALRAQKLQSNSIRDNKLDSLEDNLIDRLAEILPFMTKTGELLNAFRIINAARRTGAKVDPSLNINTQIVTLQLPQVATTKYTITQAGEVIGFNDQTLITMSSNDVVKQLQHVKG